MNKKVLIVEDDDSLREALSLLLCDEGYSVTTAVNGLDGLRTIRAAPEMPGVILLDLTMPVMNGQTFLEKQRSDPALADVPVVVLTAGNITSGRSPVVGVRCLGKPIDIDALLVLVARYCSVDPDPDPDRGLR